MAGACNPLKASNQFLFLEHRVPIAHDTWKRPAEVAREFATMVHANGDKHQIGKATTPHLIVTPEDTAEWQRRRSPKTPVSIILRLKRLLMKLDPPSSKVSLSNLRWARIGVLIAGCTLLCTLVTYESVPIYAPSYPIRDGRFPAGIPGAAAVPVEVVGTNPLSRASAYPTPPSSSSAKSPMLAPYGSAPFSSAPYGG